MKTTLKLIWFSYFCLAPLAWLPIPGLSWSLLYNLKLALVGGGVALTWSFLLSKNQLRFPLGILGPMGLLMMLLIGMFGFIQAADMSDGIRRYKDIVLGFLMLWTMYMYGRRTDDVMSLLFWSAAVVGALCCLTVLAKLTGFPPWNAPAKFDSHPISYLGFGGKRGNWASSIALYVAPLIYYLAIQKRSLLIKLIAATACLGIIGSQFAVSGRTGLVASLYIILCTMLFVFKSYKSFIAITILGIVGLMSMGLDVSEIASEQLRLDNVERRVDNNASAMELLNALSTGRIYQFFMTLDLIASKPLFGYGFGAEVYGMDVHNLWLRLAFEGGVFLPLIFLLIIIKILKAVSAKNLLRAAAKEDKSLFLQATAVARKRKILGYSVIAGVIMTMLQPNAILGSFQVTAMWWVCAGLLLAMQKEALSTRN